MVEAGGARQDPCTSARRPHRVDQTATRRFSRLMFVPRCTPRASRGGKSTARFPQRPGALTLSSDFDRIRGRGVSMITTSWSSKLWRKYTPILAPVKPPVKKTWHPPDAAGSRRLTPASAGCHRQLGDSHRHPPDATGSRPTSTGIRRMPPAVAQLPRASAGCHGQPANCHGHPPDAMEGSRMSLAACAKSTRTRSSASAAAQRSAVTSSAASCIRRWSSALRLLPR